MCLCVPEGGSLRRKETAGRQVGNRKPRGLPVSSSDGLGGSVWQVLTESPSSFPGPLGGLEGEPDENYLKKDVCA